MNNNESTKVQKPSEHVSDDDSEVKYSLIINYMHC